jgi:hypothetical protein
MLWFIPQRFMCQRLGPQRGSVEVVEPLRDREEWKVIRSWRPHLYEWINAVSQEWVKSCGTGLVLERAACYKGRPFHMLGPSV